jgi:hypothetical protein
MDLAFIQKAKNLLITSLNSDNLHDEEQFEDRSEYTPHYSTL